jgi:hypothetical protein
MEKPRNRTSVSTLVPSFSFYGSPVRAVIAEVNWWQPYLGSGSAGVGGGRSGEM